MSPWVEIPIIVLSVGIASFYLYKRISAQIRKKEAIDCPFAADCTGCDCQAPELKENCETAKDDASCGCV